MSKNLEKTINKSPERHTFQQNDDNIDFWKTIRSKQELLEQDPNWQKDNMEYDLRSTHWICDKVKGDDIYAQNLYAAMCNSSFIKLDVIPILKDQHWSCSWRHAGGIVADMQEKGDYIEWYCSGIQSEPELEPENWNDWTLAQQTRYKQSKAYVSEGVVTDEIKSDLQKLGWAVLPE